MYECLQRTMDAQPLDVKTCAFYAKLWIGTCVFLCVVSIFSAGNSESVMLFKNQTIFKTNMRKTKKKKNIKHRHHTTFTNNYIFQKTKKSSKKQRK